MARPQDWRKRSSCSHGSKALDMSPLRMKTSSVMNWWHESLKPTTAAHPLARTGDETRVAAAYIPAANRRSDAVAALGCVAPRGADRTRGHWRGRLCTLNSRRRSEYLAHERFCDSRTQSRLARDRQGDQRAVVSRVRPGGR